MKVTGREHVVKLSNTWQLQGEANAVTQRAWRAHMCLHVLTFSMKSFLPIRSVCVILRASNMNGKLLEASSVSQRVAQLEGNISKLL